MRDSLLEPEDYRLCQPILKKSLAAIKAISRGNKWVGRLTSLLRDPVMAPTVRRAMVPEDASTRAKTQGHGGYKGRKLLSIDEEEAQGGEEDDFVDSLKKAKHTLEEEGDFEGVEELERLLKDLKEEIDRDDGGDEEDEEEGEDGEDEEDEEDGDNKEGGDNKMDGDNKEDGVNIDSGDNKEDTEEVDNKGDREDGDNKQDAPDKKGEVETNVEDVEITEVEKEMDSIEDDNDAKGLEQKEKYFESLEEMPEGKNSKKNLDEAGHCDKNGENCGHAIVKNRYTSHHSPTEEPKSEGTTITAKSTKDLLNESVKIIKPGTKTTKSTATKDDPLEQELNAAYKGTQGKTTTPSSIPSGLGSCQSLLSRAQALDKRSARAGRNVQKLGQLDMKQKLEALKGFMARMSLVKEMLEEAKGLGDLPDMGERQLCQPVLRQVDIISF